MRYFMGCRSLSARCLHSVCFGPLFVAGLFLPVQKEMPRRGQVTRGALTQVFGQYLHSAVAAGDELRLDATYAARALSPEDRAPPHTFVRISLRDSPQDSPSGPPLNTELIGINQSRRLSCAASCEAVKLPTLNDSMERQFFPQGLKRVAHSGSAASALPYHFFTLYRHNFPPHGMASPMAAAARTMARRIIASPSS